MRCCSSRAPNCPLHWHPHCKSQQCWEHDLIPIPRTVQIYTHATNIYLIYVQCLGGNKRRTKTTKRTRAMKAFVFSQPVCEQEQEKQLSFIFLPAQRNLKFCTPARLQLAKLVTSRKQLRSLTPSIPVHQKQQKKMFNVALHFFPSHFF